MRWDTKTQLTDKEEKILHRAISKVVTSVMERENNPCKLSLLLSQICRQDLAVYLAASDVEDKQTRVYKGK